MVWAEPILLWVGSILVWVEPVVLWVESTTLGGANRIMGGVNQSGRSQPQYVESIQMLVFCICLYTVELDLIATEMLAFPSKSSAYKNDSDHINEKTTPIYFIIGIISIANSSDHFLSLVSQSLDCCYQIRFHSIWLLLWPEGGCCSGMRGGGGGVVVSFISFSPHYLSCFNAVLTILMHACL